VITSAAAVGQLSYIGWVQLGVLCMGELNSAGVVPVTYHYSALEKQPCGRLRSLASGHWKSG